MNKEKLIHFISVYRSLLILLVMCVIAAIASPDFLSVRNLFNVVKQVSVAGIVACGMTYVILTAGIDLSVGSILGLSGVIAASILATTGNVFLAIIAALGVGIACGAVNGLWIAHFKIPAFIATLGMMTLLRGLILVYTKGAPISIASDVYKNIGKGSLLGVPIPIVIVIVLYIISHIILTKTTFGRNVYALGGNRLAAILSGISTKATEWWVYIFNGLACGIGAIVLTARLGSAQSTTGTGIEMDAIAAVILGGTSLSGGTGYVLPTIVGAMIMGVIDNILVLMNVDPHATKVVKGAVILIAVLVDRKVKGLSAKAEN